MCVCVCLVGTVWPKLCLTCTDYHSSAVFFFVEVGDFNKAVDKRANKSLHRPLFFLWIYS